MGTIADKLNNILECKADIKSAIEEKGQLVGDAPLVEYAEKIRAIETGGGPEPEEAPWNDVRFVDFDGTCILSYSKDDFLTLTEMPTNPRQHEYLTNDGWNWSFANAKTYVQKYGYCLIGAIYKSTDDATRICVEVPEDLLNIPVNIRQSKSEGTLIDWGDGTSERFVSASINAKYDVFHTYQEAGEYIIAITPDNDCTIILEGNSYNGIFGYYYANTRLCFYNMVKWIIIGRVNYSATYNSEVGLNMEYKIAPNGGISNFNNAGYGGKKRKSIILPQSYTSISLSNVYLDFFTNKEVSLPDSLTGVIGQNCFRNNYSAKAIIIPDNVTTISTQSFQYAYSARIIIIPDSVTSILNGAFQYCKSLEYLHLPSNAQFTDIPNYAFGDCYNLKAIEIPSSVQTIGFGAFNYCFSVEEITLNEGLTTIGNNAFFGCSKIKEITIPSTVTSMGTNPFNFQPAGLYGIERLYMKPTTPPILAASVTNTFRFASDYIIYVPTGSLSAYQSATNWSAAASKMVEYDYE